MYFEWPRPIPVEFPRFMYGEEVADLVAEHDRQPAKLYQEILDELGLTASIDER